MHNMYEYKLHMSSKFLFSICTWIKPINLQNSIGMSMDINISLQYLINIDMYISVIFKNRYRWEY